MAERWRAFRARWVMFWSKLQPKVHKIIHYIVFSLLLPKRFRGATKRQIYTVIFQADTPAGKRFDVWLLVAILANTLLLMVDSIIMAPATVKIAKDKPIMLAFINVNFLASELKLL